jgi:hypothetical protein
MGTKLKGTSADVVKIGGETIVIQPMLLPQALEFIVILAPYFSLVEEYQDSISEALVAPDRPGLLFSLFKAMSEKMQEFPGDMTRAIALPLGKEPEWLAKHGNLQDVALSIPVLDQVNDFSALFVMAAQLNLIKWRGLNENNNSNSVGNRNFGRKTSRSS